MQTVALQISAVLMLGVLASFAWVVSRSSKATVPLDSVAKPAYRLRSWLLVVSLLVGAALAAFTLAPWPHDAQATRVTRHIDVKARQWSWEPSEMKVVVGEVIEFRVTSDDVNHGFALYDPQGRVVAQIQAMPTFTNKVRYHFTKPGSYKVLCLEYCGVAHHGMEGRIEVAAAASAAQ